MRGPGGRWRIAAGALFGGVGVGLGAFGAHALRGHLSEEALGWFRTAVQYQLVHALALVAAGLVPAGGRRALSAAGVLFSGGICLFSGSLYLLAVTGVRAWGAVTPFGGVSLIAGWVALASGALGCPGAGGGSDRERGE